MKKTLALLFLLCMAGLAAAQDNLSDQLRKAIVEEEANQNLDKAINAYDAILKQYGKQRVTAAMALFHLADCYRKQGEKESAIAAYKRLLLQFPEQTKLAGASRNYLTSVYNTRPEPDTADAMRTRIKELETALRNKDLETARTQAENRDRLLALLTELELSKGDPEKIAEIQKQLAELTEKYGPEHPDVIRLIEAVIAHLKPCLSEHPPE